MNLFFLGGAESIGASCACIEVEDRRWIVDCGIRMRARDGGKLPDLAALENLGAPSAILVTHAHLDHIGALPVLHQRYPLTPIYATPPTIALTRVQLLDSLRIMEEEASIEGELPLYSAATVESLLERMIPVTPHRVFHPDPGGPEVTFFPAGHIIGAAALGIASQEGNLFLSGDISVDNQRTIPGMRPPRFRADVAVFESTYGNRLHPERSAEEKRLIETVGGTIAEGGKVLVPAFAIGRAQEVILILLRAQLAGRIPEFPVHVDGMVRTACSVYSAHARYLQSTLRRRVEKHGDPFFGILDTVRAVRKPEERQQILEGGPAVIVASSGMLTGGPSPFYAAALSADPGNLIAITGYQDEESPGRQLLDAASGSARTLTLEGRQITPECRITAYALSGHASGVQIAAMARSLKAADVFLVHGDSGSRRELAELFLRERLGRVHLPTHGEPFAPAGRARRAGTGPSRKAEARRLKASGVLQRKPGDPLPPEALEGLASHLREAYPEHASFTADELHFVAFGSWPQDEKESSRFDDLLRASAFVSPHPSRLFEFVATAPCVEDDGGGLGVEALLERLDDALPRDAGLLRKSYQPGSTHVKLVFAFPDVAAARWGPTLDGVFRDASWTYEVHPLANPGELDRVIRERLPDAKRISRSPSLHLDDRTAVVHLQSALTEGEAPSWSAAALAIREETGFAVEFRERAETAPAKESRDSQGRLEINLAYRAIRDAFESEPHRPYRTGKKAGPAGEDSFIELAFISPAVGERYKDKLEGLERDIGWRLNISRVPNMAAILDTARSLLKDRPLRKGPSFRAAEGKVSVTFRAAQEGDELEEIKARFRDQTGYELEESPGR